MNKVVLIFLFTFPLFITGTVRLNFLLSFGGAQGGEIIIEDADFNSTINTEGSVDLINVAKNVTPRIVMQYGDFNSGLHLNKSGELDQVASMVASRITVEYADFISTYRLQGSRNLTQTTTAVAPRIIVEYADFIFGTDLGDDIPPVIEDVYQQPPSDNIYPQKKVVVYAYVTDYLSGVKQVILNYTANNGTWFSIEMINLEDMVYSATIPGFPYCTNIEYIVLAEDDANNTITTEDMGYEYQYHVIPEFPSPVILVLSMILTMLTVVFTRKHTPSRTPIFSGS